MSQPTVTTDNNNNETEEKSEFGSYREYLYHHLYTNNQKAFLNFYESVRSAEIELSGPPVSDNPSISGMIRFLKRTSAHNNLSLFNLHRRIAHCSFSSLPKLQSIKEGNRYASGLRFDYTPEAIGLLANDIISAEKIVLDKVASVNVNNSNEITIENVLYPLIKVDQELGGISSVVTFLNNVHPDSKVRDASTEAEKKLAKFGVDCGMREDVYKVLKALKKKITDDEPQLLQLFDYKEDLIDENGGKTSITRNQWLRYLDKNLQDFERNGLDLEDETKKSQLTAIKKRMAECSTEFSKYLIEEKSEFLLSKDELEGMDDDWLKERFDDSSNKYKVTLKYPCVLPLMKKCKSWETRKLFDQRFNSRCKDTNTKLIEELVALRCEQAKLLGKSSHSEHVLDIRMAKHPSIVNNFLTELSDKMGKKSAEELEILKGYKKKEMDNFKKDSNCKIKTDENENIMSYDFRYYFNMYQKEALKVDHDELKRYFPVRTVVEGALNIYQDMLGLSFELVAGSFEDGSNDESKKNDTDATTGDKGGDVQWQVWHDSVKLFRVRDKTSYELMGHFFLDLYPRQGKYGHACVCPIEPGCLIYELDEHTGKLLNNNETASKQLPVNIMLCNFPNPNTSPNAYLTHSDVVTFFHEFGHSMHGICGQTHIARFSGTSVERDFVEAPSQMLENWCWYEKPLLKMSKIPSDRSLEEFKKLIVKLRESKDAMPGLITKRQLFFGLLDQSMHGIENIEDAKNYDTQKECHLKQKEVWGIEDWTSTLGTSESDMKAKSNFVASFGHLAGGYDSQYYGYMWSEVYSADMFHSKFFGTVAAPAVDDGTMDDNTSGLEYRKYILQPGGSRDAIQSLRLFLGREPSDTAFLKEKGVGKDSKL